MSYEGALSSRPFRLTGFALLLIAWELAGRFGAGGKSLPALTDVLAIFTVSWKRKLLLRAALATTYSAGIGLTLGAVLGCGTAFLARLSPALSPGLDRLAVIVNAVPAIALGPILIVTAGRTKTPVLLAAIPVYFLLCAATSSGLTSAPGPLQQLFIASGADKWMRLLNLDIITALPAMMSALKIAASTSMLGAMIGEWFGAPTGLGIVILNTMQNFQVPLMWAAVLVAAGISLSAYTLIGIAERIVRRNLT